MAQEIEIKLSLDPADIDTVRAHPLLCNLPVITQDLQNTYYDTPSLDLHAKRMALRFRKKGNQWLLTVKTAEASSEGLAVRNEWEVAAEPGIFNFQHVDRSAIRDFLETLTAQLIPIFTTHFTREIRLIQHGNTKIEMAIDQGHIESIESNWPSGMMSSVAFGLMASRVALIFRAFSSYIIIATWRLDLPRPTERNTSKLPRWAPINKAPG